MVANIPVRNGPFQYVLVHRDGTTTTVPIDEEQLDTGTAEVEVEEGDTVTEVALSSTSDPDLKPARGQLWPPPAS